jgi:hypothetical protein
MRSATRVEVYGRLVQQSGRKRDVSTRAPSANRRNSPVQHPDATTLGDGKLGNVKDSRGLGIGGNNVGGHFVREDQNDHWAGGDRPHRWQRRKGAAGELAQWIAMICGRSLFSGARLPARLQRRSPDREGGRNLAAGQGENRHQDAESDPAVQSGGATAHGFPEKT